MNTPTLLLLQEKTEIEPPTKTPLPFYGAYRLETPVEFNRFCAMCEREKTFIATLGWEHGLIGECTGCGVPRLAWFTRTVSEEA